MKRWTDRQTDIPSPLWWIPLFTPVPWSSSLLLLSFFTIMVKSDGHVSTKLYFLAVLVNALIPVTKYRARSEENSGTDLLVLCLKGTSPSWRGWHGERNLLQLLSADRGQKQRTRYDHTVGPEINMKACPQQWLKSFSQDPPAKGSTAAPNSPLVLFNLSLGFRSQCIDSPFITGKCTNKL